MTRFVKLPQKMPLYFLNKSILFSAQGPNNDSLKNKNAYLAQIYSRWPLPKQNKNFILFLLQKKSLKNNILIRRKNK